jgi:hypothetical protein
LTPVKCVVLREPLPLRLGFAQTFDNEARPLQANKVVFNCPVVLDNVSTQPRSHTLACNEVVVDNPVLAGSISLPGTVTRSNDRMLD